MNKKYKAFMNTTLVILFLYLLIELIISSVNNYSYYNETVTKLYTTVIDDVDRILERETERASSFLENPFISIYDEKREFVEFDENGNFTINNIISEIPKKLTGNIYGIKTFEDDTTVKRFELTTYLDYAFRKMYDNFESSDEKFVIKDIVNSIDLVIDDFYIYEYPYQEFDTSENIYEVKMEQYGDVFLENVKDANSLVCRGLHLDERGNYLFAFGRAIKYFDNYVGFISLNYNYNSLNDVSEGNIDTYVFLENGDFFTSNEASFLKLNSNEEIEYFVKSDSITKMSSFVQDAKENKRIFNFDKIYYLNYIENANLFIVNVVETKNVAMNVLKFIVPILIIAVFLSRIIESIFNNKNINVEIAETIIELEKNNEKIENSLRDDYLTNTLSKNEMNRILQQEINTFAPSTPFSVAICDIDNMKRINNNFGLDAGDKAIKQTTDIIKEILRENDEVAMWNGHQVLILFRNTTKNEAKNMAEDIRKRIENTPLAYEEKIIRFTLCIGVAEFTEAYVKNKLLACLDKAMEEAKQSGKNKVILYKR